VNNFAAILAGLAIFLFVLWIIRSNGGRA